MSNFISDLICIEFLGRIAQIMNWFAQSPIEAIISIVAIISAISFDWMLVKRALCL